MKALLLALVLLAAPVAIAPVAAAEGPCPSNCTPPEPCGWAPDPRKDPMGYVEFWTDCFS